MNINKYISKLEELINSSSIIASYNLNIDKKFSEIAFISGKIEFRNGTILDFKEFIENTDKRAESGTVLINRNTATQQQKPPVLESQIDKMVRAGTEALPLHNLTPEEIEIVERFKK